MHSVSHWWLRSTQWLSSTIGIALLIKLCNTLLSSKDRLVLLPSLRMVVVHLQLSNVHILYFLRLATTLHSLCRNLLYFSCFRLLSLGLVAGLRRRWKVNVVGVKLPALDSWFLVFSKSANLHRLNRLPRAWSITDILFLGCLISS